MNASASRPSILGFSDPSAARMPADVLHDLGLDQVLAELQVDDELAAVFCTPLPDEASVRVRQEVFTDLDDAGVRDALADLAEAVRRAVAHRGASVRVRQAPLRHRLHLGAVTAYVRALDAAATTLSGARSTALRTLHAHVVALAGSSGVDRLRTEAARLERAWGAVRFTMLVQGSRVVVAPFDDEPDLDADAEAVLSRIGLPVPGERGADHVRTGLLGDSLGSVDGWILDAVATAEPELFAGLATFSTEHEEFVDRELERFALELPFYTTLHRVVTHLRTVGVAFAIPAVHSSGAPVEVRDVVDLALALRFADDGRRPIGNDLTLRAGERIVVVSGPNQGGKSTAARAIGQLLHLASIGCPVPAAAAQVPLTDRVLTLFPREERLESLAGGLGEEIARVHRMLETATPQSLLVMNEAFASTAADDARLMLTEVLHRIEVLGALAVCVTFLDEVAGLGGAVVSLVAEVDAADTSVRTFTLGRRPADGQAYARALAERHGLTASAIGARLEQVGR